MTSAWFTRHRPGKALIAFVSQNVVHAVGPLAGALEVGDVAARADRVAVDGERRVGVELARQRGRARLVEQELALGHLALLDQDVPLALEPTDLEVPVAEAARPAPRPAWRAGTPRRSSRSPSSIRLRCSAQYPCSGASSSRSSSRFARPIQPFATAIWRLFFWSWAIHGGDVGGAQGVALLEVPAVGALEVRDQLLHAARSTWRPRPGAAGPRARARPLSSAACRRS